MPVHPVQLGTLVLNVVNAPVDAKSSLKKVPETESASQKLLTFGEGKVELQLAAIVQFRMRGFKANARKLIWPVTGYLATTEEEVLTTYVHCKPSIVCRELGRFDVNGGGVG